MTQNPEIFEKLNDYTLSVTTDFDRSSEADPELRRIFNFAARQVTTIYSMWRNAGAASSMQVQDFSKLDSLDEVVLMHKKLCELDGHPPGLPEILTPVTKPGRKDHLDL